MSAYAKRSYLAVDGLQPQRATSGSINVNQEKESKAIMGVDSSKLDSLRLEKKNHMVFFQSSAVQIQRAVAHDSLSFLFLANRSGTWCDRLLL